MNLMLGLITPPIGMNMFIVTAIAKITVPEFLKATWPFFVVLVTVLLMITFIPDLSLLVPTWAFR
jgi:TRAP-type C4-dicarboxylate transport system permease large subunit